MELLTAPRFACFGVVNTIGVLNAYVTENQLAQYSDSEISWIFSVYIFLLYFCGLQIGPIFDARGPRMLIIVGSVCTVVSTFLIGICNGECTRYGHWCFVLLIFSAANRILEYYQFMLAFAVLNGIGSSLLFTPAIASISHWFYRRRGLATGLAVTRGSFGGVIFPLMLQKLFQEIGWPWATRVLAFILVVLCAGSIALMCSRLSAVDRAKAAAKSGSAIEVSGTDWKAMLPDPSIFLKQRGHIFLTAWGTLFIEWAFFVPVTYLPQYALSTGTISPTFSYQLIAILNAASIFGRVGP